MDGNFLQILSLLSRNHESLLRWMSRRTDKYTSAAIQNEILQVMAHRLLRQVSHRVQNELFSIMVDETTDCSTIEQCVVVVRWVDEKFEPQENFIGFYAVDATNAETIVKVIKDSIIRKGFFLSNCRGQCYDGAAVMKGVRNGVAKQILDEQPKAIFTHCYGHSLNLACQDMVRDVKLVKDALDTTLELSKLLKYSAKRAAEFLKIKEEIAPEEPGFRTLCPTRWTVRANSLYSILANYSALQASLEKFTDMAKYDHEMSARCNGIGYQFGSFDFLFGVCLGHKVLRLADNLSTALQKKSLSADEGQRMGADTVRALEKLRSEEEFEKFWKDVQSKLSTVDVEEPQLPRRRRAPARLHTGTAAPYFPSTLEEVYRPVYYNAVDSIIAGISDRFDQPGLRQYQHLEQLLLKGASGSDFTAEKDAVAELWGDELNMDLLESQLHILAAHFSENNALLSSIAEYLSSLPSQHFLSEVVTMMKLILVAPATNATSERSFSTLRRLKTYLRSTMSQERLNHCAILTIMKEECDGLDLNNVGKDFAEGHQHRMDVFGKFC